VNITTILLISAARVTSASH